MHSVQLIRNHELTYSHFTCHFSVGKGGKSGPKMKLADEDIILAELSFSLLTMLLKVFRRLQLYLIWQIVNGNNQEGFSFQ